MANTEVVTDRNGHSGLTVCPTCGGTGHLPAGTQGNHGWVNDKGAAAHPRAKNHDVHCVSCLGSGLLEPHSCFG
jgi:hypothetical protein